MDSQPGETAGPIDQTPPERRERARTARVIVSRTLPPKRPPNMAPRPLRGRHQPLTVTPAALVAVSAVRANQHGRAEQAVGIALDADGGLELILDEPGEHDRRLAWNGEVVLFVTVAADDRLAGYALDHVQTPSGARFTLDPVDSHELRP